MRTSNDLSDNPENVVPLTSAVFFILFSLAGGEKHGYAIIQQVSVLSEDTFRMGPGTLYTTIHRLLDAELIEERLHPEELDARKRYYRLTPSGRALLKAELARMDSLVRRARQTNLVPRHAR